MLQPWCPEGQGDVAGLVLWNRGCTGPQVGVFSYIEAAFTGGGNSQARFAGERQLEAEGDGSADFALLLDPFTAADQPTASDFLRL